MQELGSGKTNERPVRLGGALVTIVEPEKGHEVAYNRWYERDHFYAGCMIGAWNISGARFVATKDLKALRYPAELAGAHRPEQRFLPGSLLGPRPAPSVDWMQWGSAPGQVAARQRPHVRRARTHPHPHVQVPHRVRGPRRGPGRAGPRPSLAVRGGGDRRTVRGHVARRCRRLVRRTAPARRGRRRADAHPAARQRCARREGRVGGEPLLPALVRRRRPARHLGRTPSAPSANNFTDAGLGQLVSVAPFRATIPGTDTYTDQLW